MRRVLQVYSRQGEGRGGGVRKPAEKERGKTGGEGWGCTCWGDRRKLETFQSRDDGTDPRTPEAALAAPIEKPEMLEGTAL